MTTREIVYSPKDRDYALYLGGELVGFARSYTEGEQVLDELTHGLLQGTFTLTRTPQERLTLFTEAYRAAKCEGRDLDASRYQSEALSALAETLGITVEQMLAEQAEMKAEAA